MINGQIKIRIPNVRCGASRILLLMKLCIDDDKEIKSGFVFIPSLCEKAAYVLS